MQCFFLKLNSESVCYVCLLVLIISCALQTQQVLKPSHMFGLIFFNKTGFVQNHKISVCFSMVTNVCFTSEHCTTHSHTHFDLKANLVDMR